MSKCKVMLLFLLLGSVPVMATPGSFSYTADFNTDGVLENWTVVDNATGVVEGGVLKITSTGNDPKMRIANLEIPADQVAEVRYRVRQKVAATDTEWIDPWSNAGTGFGISGNPTDGESGLFGGSWLGNGYQSVYPESEGWNVIVVDVLAPLADRGLTAPPNDSDSDGNWDSIRLDPIGNANEYCEVDYVHIKYSSPTEASNPFPADGVINQPISLTLQCDAGKDPNNFALRNSDVTGHYVYLKTYDIDTAPGEPNWIGVTPITVADTGSDPVSLFAVNLTNDITVFWRVDEAIDGSSATDPNTVTGTDWSYQTLRSVPILISGPSDQVVDPASTANYTTVFSSNNTPTATWYTEDGTPVNTGDADVTVTLIQDGGSGDYTSTLEIANAEVADQDRYYCALDMQDTPMAEPIETAGAQLVVKQLIARYEFENDATDSVGTNDGIAKDNDDPNTVVGYAAGQIGQAIQLDGTQYVELPLGAFPNNEVGGGMHYGTISLWAKINNGASFIGNYNGSAPETNLDFRMWSENTQIRFYQRQLAAEANNVFAPSSSDLNIVNDGKIHMITATYAKGGDAVVYLDGQAIGSVTAMTDPEFAPFNLPHILGGLNHSNSGISALLNGLLDDVRFYNYALTPEKVADLYFAATGEGVCIYPEQVTEQMDFDGNCKIDISDFSALAAEWLDCGLYPTCLD